MTSHVMDSRSCRYQICLHFSKHPFTENRERQRHLLVQLQSVLIANFWEECAAPTSRCVCLLCSVCGSVIKKSRVKSWFVQLKQTHHLQVATTASIAQKWKLVADLKWKKKTREPRVHWPTPGWSLYPERDCDNGDDLRLTCQNYGQSVSSLHCWEVGLCIWDACFECFVQLLHFIVLHIGLTPSIFYSVGNIGNPKLFWNPSKSMINFNRTKSVKFSLQVISRSWTHEDLSPARFIMVRLLSASVTQKSSHHPLWRHTNSVFRSQKGIQQQQCRSNGHQIFPSSQKREEKKSSKRKNLKIRPFCQERRECEASSFFEKLIQIATSVSVWRDY